MSPKRDTGARSPVSSRGLMRALIVAHRSRARYVSTEIAAAAATLACEMPLDTRRFRIWRASVNVAAARRASCDTSLNCRSGAATGIKFT